LSTLLWIGLTVVAYVIAYRVDRRFKHGFLSPMFVGSAIVMALLLATHTDSKTYAPSRDSIDEFLGPAMIALAIPLYNKRQTLRRHLRTIAVSLVAGSVSTMAVAIWLGQAFGLSQSVSEAVGLKSVTAPVAIAIATQLGANTGIAALGVFLTARIGDLAGPAILTFGRVSHPFARGLAMGCISTAGGVARISKEGELPAAVGGVAVSVTALAISLVAGMLVPYIREFGFAVQRMLVVAIAHV
jgi:putative effector of murein hydrolase